MKQFAVSRGEGGPDRLFRVLAGVLVFLGCLYFLTVALSVSRVVITQLLAWLVALVSLLAAGIFNLFLPSGLAASGHPAGRSPALPAACGRLLISLGLIFFGLLWLVACLVPDTGFDGLWYHNPTMHFWALKGYPHWIEGGSGAGLGSWGDLISQRFNGWPKGIELFGFMLVRAAGLARLLNTVNLPFLALGVLSIALMARFFGAPADLAWMSGLLFLFVPVNIDLGQTTLIDPAAASCYLALMALTAVAVRALARGEVSIPLALPLGVALGLSVGAKGPGIVLFPLVVGILVASVAISGRRSYRRGTAFIAVTVLAVLLCGSYWHLRNWLITGSPVYPNGISLGGRTIFPGLSLAAINPPPYAPGTEGWTQLQRIVFSWLENLGSWRESAAGKDPKSGGLGVVWILGCLPALVAYLLQEAGRVFSRPGPDNPRPRVLVTALPFSAILLITAVLFFAMPPHHNHKARYVLFLYGPGLSVLAVAAGRILARPRGWARRAGLAWVSLAAVLMVGQGLYAFSHRVGLLLGPYPPARSGEGILSWLSALAAGRPSAGYFWPELRSSAFERIFGDGRPVAIGPLQVMAQPILGHLSQYEDFGRREIYFIEPALAGDPGQVGDYLRRRAVRYVIWQQGMLLPPALKRLAVLDEPVGNDFRLLVVDPGPGEGNR